MKQFLSLKQLDLITDYFEILKEAEKLKAEILKTKTFLFKFGFNGNIEKMMPDFVQQVTNTETDRKIARLYYLRLKVVLIDLLLVVNDNQLKEIYKAFNLKPGSFDQFIQGAKITTETRPEIVKNLNLYLAFKPEHQPANFPIFTKYSKN
jgi:hypothetical protein